MAGNSRGRNTGNEGQDHVWKHHVETKDLDEANEEVGIRTVEAKDLGVIESEDLVEPRVWRGRQGLLTLAIPGEDVAGLENADERLAAVQDEPEGGAHTDGDSGSDQRGHERRRGGRGRVAGV